MWVWFERVGVGVDLIGTNGDGLIELMELSCVVRMKFDVMIVV